MTKSQTTPEEDKIWNAAIFRALQTVVARYVVEESESHKFVNQHISKIAKMVKDLER